jgi:excinuclease ABC subunit B
VLVGVNLLREGLDIPEVSLVAILDADKEGYLRSERSLIQTIGRAARNVNGLVLMYADKMTGSLQRALEETNRRRELQQRYNEAHNITPTSIVKDLSDALAAFYDADYVTVPVAAEAPVAYGIDDADVPRQIKKLRKEMKAAAERYDFERAAKLRDQIFALEERQLELRL